jgi:hypothetical protein
MPYNGMDYTLLKRSDKVAIYSMQGGRRWEVSMIYILPEIYFDDKYYPRREAISNNNQFGRDGSKFFNNEEQAKKYFDILNRSIEATEECEITVDDLSDSKSTEGNNITNQEIGPEKDLPNSTAYEKSDGLLHLKNTFRKNGYIYHIHERSAKVVLIKAMYGDTISFYEVCIISISHAETILGKYYPQRETLPSNEEFGNEGSKSFFGYDYESAKKYFDDLSQNLKT